MKYIVLHRNKIIGNTVELDEYVNVGDYIIFEGYREVLNVNRIVAHPGHRMIQVGDILEDAKS